MRIQSLLFFSCLLSFFYSNQLQANIYHAKATGLWHDTGTWLESGIPGVGDQVIIDGFTVTVNNASGNVTVDQVTLENATGLGHSSLVIDGNVTFTVTYDLMVFSSKDTHVDLEIWDKADLIVGGNAYFDRLASNSFNKSLTLSLVDSASMNVILDFVFDYNSSAGSENSEEIILDDNSSLIVNGTTTLRNDGGNSFSLDMYGNSQISFKSDLILEMTNAGTDLLVGSYSPTTHLEILGNANMTNEGGVGTFMLGNSFTGGSITIGGSANLTSTIAGAQVILNASGPSGNISVGENINMIASGSNNAIVGIVNQATLSLRGTINRTTNHGRLTMDAMSTLSLNGSIQQNISTSDIQGASTDSLFITNIAFNNTSDEPMILEGPLVVNEYLELNSGIIKTTSTNKIIIKDGAGIDAGNASTYIDGPITKIGSTNGASFTFPVGNGDTYAPIEISALATSQSEYTAQVFKNDGDPPPFGNYGTGVGGVCDSIYWTLDKKVDSEDVEVTLHWEDISANDFAHIDSLIVVGLDGSDWVSYGNNGTTGVMAGVGSVTSKGDPPPFGISAFTVGETVTTGSGDKGSLPVELIRFGAKQKDDEVDLYWETASELNTNSFAIERSVDGVNFEIINNIPSQGEGVELKKYVATDDDPFVGANFYRLKIIDKDGSYEYSGISLVKFKVLPGVSVYPNPVADMFIISGGTDLEQEGALMEVFDVNGYRLFAKELDFENGRAEISTDNVNIDKTGTYLIRLTVASETYHLKLMKIE